MPMIDHITDEQADLIRNAKVFFVASADPSFGNGPNGEGPVNLSPKVAADLQVDRRATRLPTSTIAAAGMRRRGIPLRVARSR